MSDRIREWIESASEELAELLLDEQDVVEGAIGVDLRASELLLELGRRGVERAYEELAVRLVDSLKDEGYSVERAPKVRFLVAQGYIEVRSPYLRRPGAKEGLRPLRDEYGVHGGRCSDLVLRWTVDFGVERSFAKAAEAMMEHHGLEVGATTVRLRTLSAAKSLLEWQTQKLADAPGAEADDAVDTVFVEADGCHLPVVRWEKAGRLGRTDHPRDKRLPVCEWTEVRTGLVRVAGSVTPRVVCLRGTYDDLNEALEGLINLSGGGLDTQIVGICDGANGLKESLERRFPGMRFVLDRGHLRSHLYRAAQSLEITDRHAWVDAVAVVLGAGGVDFVMAGLEPLAAAEVAANAGTDTTNVLDNLRRHLQRFRDNVAYAEYERRGWPVGSGEVESAHRYIPQARLKKAGAWWLREHLDPMLAARTVRANDQWDEYWRTAA